MNHPNTPEVALVTQQHGSSQAQRGYPSKSYGFESTPPDDDSDGGLVEYWRILRRHRRSILLASLVGLILGFAVGIPMKPIYRAKTSLEVLTLNEDFMNLKQASPTTTNDGSYETSEEQTQAKLLESSALLQRVAAKLDPGSPSVPLGSHLATSGWRAWLHLPEPSKASQRQNLIEAAIKSLKVRPTPRTRVLEVSVDSADPQLATDFANTLTQEFINLNMESRWATTQRTGEWLRKELDDVRNKLRSSEAALQDYARTSGLIFTDETTNVATEKLQQLQQNLSSATADRISKQSRFELAEKAPPDSLGDVLTDTALRDTQSKINEMKREIADLSAVYNPEYSKVRRLQAALESLQPAFEQQRNDILTRIKNDYTESSRREKLLAAAYNAQAQNVTGQDEKAIQYNILKRDVDSNRQLYDTMLQQMKQAAISSAMRASNVRVVDPADLPDSPVSPNFKLNSVVGMLSGFFLSIVVVTFKERADRTLQQPGDIKLWVEIPELGAIPAASLDSQTPIYYRSPGQIGSSVRAALAGKAAGDANDLTDLVTWRNKPSLIAEAFRSALTSILFIGENGGSRPKVLVFTSANPADGKTTVASNIAIAAAEIRLRVLLIDADLRRPRMHQLFDLSNESGLTDLLQHQQESIEPHQLIKQTGIDGLHIITSGPPTHAASHLLYSPNFALAISALRNDYDMILIDTPPMLQITDARVAGRLADATILVARSGVTTRDSLIAVRERLNDDGITILGTILNDWNPKNSPNGYYGNYRSRYYSDNRYHQDAQTKN